MKKLTILIIAFLVSFPTSYSQLCQWADMIDGSSIDYVECVTNDAAGNFYVCGSSSSGTINFNNGITLTSSGYYDGFIAKYNSDGLCQWARKIAGSSNDKAYSCNVDFEGSVIVTGEFESYTLWLDDSVSLSGYGTSDSYIAKYNNNGYCLWAERIYGTGRHRGYSITTDGAGNIYIGGEFSQSVNFNNSISLTSSGGTYTYDGFVAKYNYYGNCQWANKVYGTQSEEVNSLTLDNNGNIYAAGTFNSPTVYINENISLLNTAGLDVFIAKYDNFGVAQWFTKISSINGDKTYSIDFDGSEHLYIGGSYFGASVEFNNGISLTNSGSEDAFFAKYDLTGLCQWAEKTTGTSDELVYSVKVKDLNTIYIGGYFRNQPVTFNNSISLSNSGAHDAFFAEYNSSGECQWAEKIAGAAQEWVRSIDYAQNGIYLGGSFESTLLNFNNDISLTYSTYSYGGFIAKYSLPVQLTAPVLISPENNATNYVFNPFMQWQPVENASSYSLQISTTNDFSSLLADESGITETNYQVFGLTNNTNYYWRVCAVAGSQTGNWSEVWNFLQLPSIIEWNGHSYQVFYVPNGINWQNAQNSADDLGGYLACVTSEEENNAIYDLISLNPELWFIDSYNNGIGPWLGGFQPAGSDEPDGNWQWVNGAPFEYTNWAPGEPNNAGNEDRICYFGPQTLMTDNWNDISANNLIKGYVVEFEMPSVTVLSEPQNNSNEQATELSLVWTASQNANAYNVEVSLFSDFNQLVFSEYNTSELSFDLENLQNETTYYWRVQAKNDFYLSQWSEIWNFTTFSNNVTFNINLTQGWNQISSNVIPENPNMVEVFSEISENIVLVKNGMGLIYSPEFQINNIGDWDITQGYQVYSNSDCVLEISGIQVIPDDTPFELNAGWNLIAFVHPYEVSAEVELESIIPYLIIAKDNFGRMFVPEYNINTIGDMLPSQGYWVYVTQSVILTHPQLDRK